MGGVASPTMTRLRTDHTPPAILLKDVAQRLGFRWALRGVSVSVDAGELVAVVGHNGSGKTTLLRVISTAIRPTRGDAFVFGHDLRRDPDGARALLTMLTNGGGLYGDLTAAENLAFAQRMATGGQDQSAIDGVLERVGLSDTGDALIRTFSSGMQRRLSLARVFLRDARLLLLDEPYNSLDPAGGALVDELLLETKARNGAAVVVLHDLDRSGVVFDRVIELREGRVAGARHVQSTGLALRAPA
jgi:heme exporter protein A